MDRRHSLALRRGLQLLSTPPIEHEAPVADIAELVAAEVRKAVAALPKSVSVPGKTPVKGVDYFDGENGYNPVKGVDYFDGKTPIKGVDYSDGEPGKDGAGIASVELDGSDIVFRTTDENDYSVSIIPIVERVIDAIEIPELNTDFLMLDKARPFEVRDGKLYARRAGGQELVVMTIPASKQSTRGGGISGQRARTISRKINFHSTSVDYTAAADVDVIECDTSGGDIAITVPTGRETWLHIKRSGSGSVTVQPEGGALIEGEDCRILNVNLWALRIAWNGSEYREF